MPLGIFTHDFSDDHKHTDIFYAFITNELPRLAVSKGESLDLRWFDKKGLNELNDNEIFSGMKQVYNFVLDTCIKSWDRVSTSSFRLT